MDAGALGRRLLLLLPVNLAVFQALTLTYFLSVFFGRFAASFAAWQLVCCYSVIKCWVLIAVTNISRPFTQYSDNCPATTTFRSIHLVNCICISLVSNPHQFQYFTPYGTDEICIFDFGFWSPHMCVWGWFGFPFVFECTHSVSDIGQSLKSLVWESVNLINICWHYRNWRNSFHLIRKSNSL